jgi:serine/threonine-protein kinase HipA
MNLFYERHRIGEILETGEAEPVFRYDADWCGLEGAFPISTTLPLRREPYAWPSIAPWLLNLLPEDEETLRLMARNVNVPHTDILGLLERVGRDTSGAVSFSERGTAETHVKPIAHEAELERVIEELPRKPFLAGEDGVSMSLAGVQTKLTVRMLADGGLAIPIAGSASSHILKPDSRRLFGSVQNEALCLTLARRSGLRAPKVVTGRAGARSYLLVERYDREDHEGLLRRIHQEDFCQALGLPPSAKYEHAQARGAKASFSKMADRLRELGAAADLARLWDAMVFNLLCCNTDAHAKNYSVLISAAGVELAPIYDVMCAKAWDGITSNLALDIAHKRNGDHIEGRHWRREAEACGMRADAALSRVIALANKVLEALPKARSEVEAMPAGGHVMLARLQDAIAARCERVLRTADR